MVNGRLCCTHNLLYILLYMHVGGGDTRGAGGAKAPPTFSGGGAEHPYFLFLAYLKKYLRF